MCVGSNLLHYTAWVRLGFFCYYSSFFSFWEVCADVTEDSLSNLYGGGLDVLCTLFFCTVSLRTCM
ncbi:hypothetical protein BDV30DRAFT_221548 [Aspergillus minisclerotigenes]|uniref:Uncharacterized protein n=1 Tax=Aspergillus minisclerotigenes TaxID=656917 RepID=A0A5N6ILA0_9EURO|nr:hypothetical protein BDV30DRAFT_221548 [Aspergillus minisclerotigenes]